MPLIPALGSLRQEDLGEFKAYRASSRIVSDTRTQKKPCLKKTKQSWAVVAYAFNLSTCEVEANAGGSL